MLEEEKMVAIELLLLGLPLLLAPAIRMLEGVVLDDISLTLFCGLTFVSSVVVL